MKVLIIILFVSLILAIVKAACMFQIAEKGVHIMPTCDCCLQEGAKPLWTREERANILRGELGLKPDAALCDHCWRATCWTLQRHWLAEEKARGTQKFDDCGKD